MADENNNGADFVPTALEVQHGRGLARGMDIVDGDVARVVAGANDPHTVGGKAALSLRTTLARLTAEVATYQRALQLALCLCDPPSVDACKEWIADREARDEEFGQ